MGRMRNMFQTKEKDKSGKNLSDLLKIKISNLPKKEFQSCPLNRKQMDKHSENSEMVTHLRCTEAPHRIYTELKNTLAGFNSRVDEVEE